MVWPTEDDQKLDEYDAMDLPGQQLPAAHAHTPLDHILNLDIKSPAGCQRLTGIIATMGKSTTDVEVLEKMMSAGMNIALLNLSFGTKDEHLDTIKTIRQTAKNYSIKMEKVFPLAIAARLPGRKIRTGYISDSYGDSVELIAGEVVRLTTDETYKDRCSTYTVYVDFMHFAEQMSKGNYVLLDNETIQLKVEMISSTTLTCKIERGGFLGSYKDVFVPNVTFDMPNYTETDKMYIEMAVRNQLDILIASFVNSANAITELRHLMGEKGKKIAIVANIQTIEGFRNFDDILSIANGIMITRQELGSDITPKKLVIAQKNMIARANKVNIPICVSAHLLSSMRYNETPLRSELLDIGNCILDGADALVLSAETAVGQYPAATVACMATICKEAEACIWTKQIFEDFIEKTPLPCDQTTGAALSAVMAAQRSLAAAIIVVTSSGKSAQVVAKYRPRCPIIAVTRYAAIARQLHMWRGIIPLVYEADPSTDWQQDLDSRVNFCTKWAMGQGFIRIGDPIVLVSGWKQGSGSTNTMRIIYATADMANQ
ncbi:pyruvate kinase-like [Vanessa tameamea]|uniref:Pyruvate kinase n=1 Tax=Vanessa tameamea TaxID=334116 RepID=A0A8B8IIM8_VANTA|nr:pyruvate kinase-like [Vanessa tameamea]